jgi:hypothetical protein
VDCQNLRLRDTICKVSLLLPCSLAKLVAL